MELSDLVFESDGQSFRVTSVEQPLIEQLARQCHDCVFEQCYHGVTRNRRGEASHQVWVNGPLGGSVAQYLSREGHCYDVIPTADPNPSLGPQQTFYSTFEGLKQLSENHGIGIRYERR